jgi:hypothetical protein
MKRQKVVGVVIMDRTKNVQGVNWGCCESVECGVSRGKLPEFAEIKLGTLLCKALLDRFRVPTSPSYL